MRLVRMLGLVAVLAGIPAGAPPASAVGEELGGWSASASASAFTVFPAIPSLIPYDAPVEASVSHTHATLATGGTAFGRASTLWPGVLAGLGPLFKQVNPDAPTLPDYPLVLESREFEEPKRSEQAGVVMRTDVTPARAIVESVAGGQGVEGVFTIGGARSISTATVESAFVAAQSSTRVTDIVLADGQVTIDAVTTLSTASSDGSSGTCDGGAVVSGLVIGGVPATVDRSGVHAAEQDATVPVDADTAISSVLEPIGLQLRVVGGIAECDGPAAGRSTGGLLISLPLPAGGPVPPGGTLNVIIGSSAVTAEAVAAPLFDVGVPAPPIERAPAGASLDTPAPIPTGTSATPAVGGDAPALFSPIDDDRPVFYEFGGVPASMVVGLLLLAVPATTRVRRYVERVIALTSV